MIENLFYFILATIIMVLFIYFDRFLHRNISFKKSVILHIFGNIVFLFTFFLLVIKEFEKSIFMYVGIFVILLGAILSILAFLSLKENIIITKKFVNKGVYSYVRNPFYLSLLISCFGFFILTLSIFVLIYTIILFFMILSLINYEEKILMKKYSEYKEYRKNVPCLIPRINFK